MKKGLPLLIFIGFSCHFPLLAQQSVSIGTTNTNPSAVLWLNSPGQNQALIIPVVSNVSAVPSPVAGMVVYDQSANAMFYRNGTAWVQLAGAVSLTAGAGINISGSTISNSGDTNPADDITTATAAAGDLAGTYPAPTVAKLRGIGVSATAPTTNQVLQYNGTNWTPSSVGAGTVTSAGLTMPSIFSVTGSPITSSGAFGVTMASQAAGTVLAAPTASAGVPSFRALAASDIGTGTLPVARGGTGLATAPTNGQILIGNGTGYTQASVTAGTGINITNGAGSISISSTGLINPMTATGDVIYGGASGTPTRLATATGFLKGGTTPSWSSINLASDVTGTLPLARGGTGLATAPTNGQILIGNGTGYTQASVTAGTGINITNGAGSISISSTGLINPMTTAGDVIYGGASGAPTRLATATGFLKGGATPSWSSINLASDVTGTLPLTRGGTGLTTAPANGQLLIGNGTGFAQANLTAGTGINITNGAGTVSISSTGLINPMTATGDLIVGGASGAPTRLAGTTGFLRSTGAATPTWAAVNLAGTDVAGTLPLTAGGTGATTAAAARTNLGLGALATLGTVGSTEIADASIMNADVNVAAAIAGTKISPNFGAQNITTTGAINGAALTTTGAVTMSSLAGTGSRTVVADAAGVLSTQTVPSFSTLNVVPKGDGTSGLVASTIFDNGHVGIGTTTPYNQFSILGPNGTANGGHQSFFTTADAHPTIQFMNWGHNDVAILFDSYLSTTNSWTSSNATSNFKIHKNSNLTIQYESGTAAGSPVSWATALTVHSNGNVTNNNFTRLGSTGPFIKTVKLTGTTSASSGGSVTVTVPGVSLEKIMSVYASVQYATTAAVPSNYTINSTYEFQHYFYESGSNVNVVIWNKSGNDGSLLSKPFTVFVTYEE